MSKPLKEMTLSELQSEWEHWNDKITEAPGWSAAIAAADEFRRGIETEMARRNRESLEGQRFKVTVTLLDTAQHGFDEDISVSATGPGIWPTKAWWNQFSTTCPAILAKALEKVLKDDQKAETSQ